MATNRSRIVTALRAVKDGGLLEKAYADHKAEEERKAQEHRKDRAARVRRAVRRFAEEMEEAPRDRARAHAANLKEALHFLNDDEVYRLAFLIHEEGA